MAYEVFQTFAFVCGICAYGFVGWCIVRVAKYLIELI